MMFRNRQSTARRTAAILGLLVLSPRPAWAHHEQIHAVLVVEAHRFMSERAAYSPILERLSDAGWDEAWAASDTPFGKCTVAARFDQRSSIGNIVGRVNLVAREACKVDAYEDMYADVWADDFSDIGMLVVDAGQDIMQFAGRISGLADMCAQGGVWDCFMAALGALLAFAVDLGGTLLAIGLLPIIGTLKVIFEAFGANMKTLLGPISGIFNPTSFNHLQHAEAAAQWTGKNDYAGYSVATDPASGNAFDAGGLRSGGYLLSDALGLTIDYDNSPALKNYRQNGSQLTKSQFDNKLVTQAEFEPMDNMATFGMSRALETGDLTYLGRPLHVAGDASVPYHVIGYGGKDHTDYESRIRDSWNYKRDAWVSDSRIEQYLALPALSPDLSAQQIVTNTAKMTNQLGTGSSDALDQQRISLAIAAIVALLVHYDRAATKAKTVASEVAAARVSPQAFMAVYPFPESPHKNSNYERFAEFFWIEDEAGMPRGQKKCSSMDIRFSPRTAGAASETLAIYRYPEVGKAEPELVQTLPVSGLAGQTISVPDAAGLVFRHQRGAADAPGWGFRITDIACR